MGGRSFIAKKTWSLTTDFSLDPYFAIAQESNRKIDVDANTRHTGVLQDTVTAMT